MLIIGEKINASNRAVAKAIAKRDEEYIANLARAQAAAGADFIDVNAGIGHNYRQHEAWLVALAIGAEGIPQGTPEGHYSRLGER